MKSKDCAQVQNASPWLVMVVISLGGSMVLLNLGTLNVALPVIARQFHTNAVTSNWILMSYMLVNTILILVFGPLADIFGRGKLYLLGMAIFILTSLLIGFSPNVWVLILLRVVQAIGGALIITNQTALVTDAFPRELLGRGLGINVLVAAVAQLLGPVIGGFLASTFGWRWVFWFNVPFGLIAFIWGIFVLRGVSSKVSGEKIDVFGSVIVFMSLGGLIIALSESGVAGWTDWTVISGIALFVLLIPLFIFVERRATSPMVDFTLFRNRAYAMANLSTFLSFFTQTAVVLLISLYYQIIANNTSFQAGLKTLPIMLGMLIVSPIAGYLTDKYSPKVLSSIGLAMSDAGLLILIITLRPDAPYWGIAIALMFVGTGFGLFLTPNTTTIMALVPAQRRGAANGIRSMLNNMGQVLSTAISLMIVIALLPMRLKNVIFSAATSELSKTDFYQITISFRWALFSLFVAALLGTVASLLRDPVRHY